MTASKIIPLNCTHITGKESDYIQDVINTGVLSGNGPFTKRCQSWLEVNYGFHKTMLTSSCTDALEMAALLLDVKHGDEIIMPSYTFVSTANAFVLRGAKIVFADSRSDHPGIDEATIESLITPRTKVIVVVHYAGVACDMDVVMDIAARYQLKVVEDAAQAIDCYYRDRPLGGIGDLGTFSFHATKNIHCGEGGALIINDPALIPRAEILWEHGTDRAAFIRGEVEHYQWRDIGSSFLPSELNAAFLLAQLQTVKKVSKERRRLVELYLTRLSLLFQQDLLIPPKNPSYSTNNGHISYVICRSSEERESIINYLGANKIQVCAHYQPLHSSAFSKSQLKERDLINVDRYSNCLLRLPIFFGLKDSEVITVCDTLISFFQSQMVLTVRNKE